MNVVINHRKDCKVIVRYEIHLAGEENTPPDEAYFDSAWTPRIDACKVIDDDGGAAGALDVAILLCVLELTAANVDRVELGAPLSMSMGPLPRGGRPLRRGHDAATFRLYLEAITGCGAVTSDARNIVGLAQSPPQPVPPPEPLPMPPEPIF